MIFTERKIWLLPLIFFLALWLGGCSSHNREDDLNPKEDGISLILNISTNDISAFGTRAVEDPDYFEQPTLALATEKINSLRIIIVDVQPGSKTENKVIHNYYTGNLSYARFSISGIRFDNLNFSSTYRIYLIANENGLPPSICDIFTYDETDDSKGLPPGMIYNTNILENLILPSKDLGSGSFLINNESSYLGNGANPVPIPMTEIFELTTDSRPNTNAEEINYYMERNFFITRAASKFSFQFKRDGEISDKYLELKSIKISGLGTQEYLFPKNTIYSQNGKEYKTTDPNQDYSSLKPSEGLEIKEFELPPGGITGEYEFGFTQNISAIGSEGKNYEPQIYFPESKGNNGVFQCSLSFDGTNYTAPITLPNLTSLPRNTKVLINVTFHEIGFEISVESWVPGGRTEIEM